MSNFVEDIEEEIKKRKLAIKIAGEKQLLAEKNREIADKNTLTAKLKNIKNPQIIEKFKDHIRQANNPKLCYSRLLEYLEYFEKREVKQS